MSVSPTKTYKFSEVIEQLNVGLKIRRNAWEQDPKNSNVFGQVFDKKLMLFINDQYHPWIVNDEDLKAEDWTIIN